MFTKNLELSVVVPAKNEQDNIIPLIDEIYNALWGKVEFEIIYINDGSTDNTLAKLEEAARKYSVLRYFSHKKSCGQSRAIITGIERAKGKFIGTLDGDGQNVPEDLLKLYSQIKYAPDWDKVLMAGHRVNRQDKKSKKLTSKLGNAIRQKLLHDNTPDTGCGTKVFSRNAFMEMPHFDHMHRYLPALIKRQGGRVISVPVQHRPRATGASNYGFWDRLWVGIADIFGVMWLMRRGKKSSVIDGNS